MICAAYPREIDSGLLVVPVRSLFNGFLTELKRDHASASRAAIG